MSTAPKTLFEKVWEQHVVVEPKGEPTLLYIDLQLLHEVTSPAGLRGPSTRRTQGAPPRSLHRDRGPQRSHDD